ncbi:alpha-D-ribose 1-methylphosphonate 5-triphosphate synthase subunit PhnI [Alteromonadaceae bacterium 2753L.S.0a.02]|nr:alpha-D-ribose 1-methylphosphonate 5-triphosphate synthase subunit PhnI [Alteromonadaceae bacterium 2753L.S.0a.02]
MAYVAIKGGAQAIANSEALFDYLRTREGETAQPLQTSSITHQLRLLHSRVLSEGGVYHPEAASLAIKQAQGDTLEAAFILRAYRSTLPRIAQTTAHNTLNMRLTRRISSAFKDIPGGQMLGATSDYQLRLLREQLRDENPENFRAVCRNWFADIAESDVPDCFPKVLAELQAQGLVAEPPQADPSADAFDITREPLSFPTTRSAALATMARAEQGALLALAYSNMRGYGDVHPTVAELRVGFLPVLLPHPITGKAMEVGEIEVTECEVVAMYQSPDQTSSGKPLFTLGYGACFGHNEVKAISMAILDRALQNGFEASPQNPSEDPEFVLLHIDGIDSMGFCTHYKMPHYVTFQSDMDRLRRAQKKIDSSETADNSHD